MKRVFPFLAVVILMLFAVGVYGGVKDHDFVHLDDFHYVVDNPHLQEPGLSPFLWALSADLISDSPHADYWQPVTFFSRILDVRLFGLNPSAHHLMNFLYHTVNASLLFILLMLVTGSRVRSLLVALLFLVHPLQVEPVAWVTARKDLLAVLFTLLGLLLYAGQRPKDRPGIKWSVWLCFFLAVGSKSQYAVFPALLLILDFWPLRRILSAAPKDWWKPLFEKAVMTVFAVLIMAMTCFAFSNEWQASPANIFGHIGVNSLRSFSKLFVPSPLAVIYPESVSSDFSPLLMSLSYLFLIGVSLLTFLNRHRRYLLAGWAWYVVMTAPVMVGRPGDRYLYLAGAGIWIALIWGGYDWFRLSEKPFRRTAGLILMFTLITGFAFAARQQVRVWKNDVTLFGHAAHAVSGNKVAWLNYGVALGREGQYEEASEAFYAALKIDPNLVKAHVNLGYTLTQAARILMRGQDFKLGPSSSEIEAILDAAHSHLMLALRIAPNNAAAYHNLGSYYEVSGHEGTARDAYRKAAELDPGLEKARLDLVLLESKRQSPQD